VDSQHRLVEQKDTRFGRNGHVAWIYFIWPLGPLPGVLISIWGIAYFWLKGGSVGAIVVIALTLIYCIWLCLVGILLTKEAFNTVQRVEFDENTVVAHKYLGSKIILDRNERVVIKSIRTSKVRRTMTFWTGLVSAVSHNWLIDLPDGRALVLDGECFDPEAIFPKAERTGASPRPSPGSSLSL